MVVYLFVVIQIYNKFSGFLLLFILLSAKTSSLACMCMHTRAPEWRSFSGQQYLNSLNCNGFKPTFCVYRTTIILFHPFNPFNPCSFTTEFFFEHGFIGLTQMLRLCGGTVFQTALLFMVINPETASRVTLALLAIVFQTKPPSTHTYYSTNAIICYWWLPWSVPVMYSPQK